MLLGHVVRYQQKDQQLDRLAIRRFEWDRLGQSDKSSQWRLQAAYAPMWHGNALTKASGAQSLARKEVIGNGGAGDPAVILENQACLLECPLFAGALQVEDHIGFRENLAEMSHDASH